MVMLCAAIFAVLSTPGVHKNAIVGIAAPTTTTELMMPDDPAGAYKHASVVVSDQTVSAWTFAVDMAIPSGTVTIADCGTNSPPSRIVTTSCVKSMETMGLAESPPATTA